MLCAAWCRSLDVSPPSGRGAWYSCAPYSCELRAAVRRRAAAETSAGRDVTGVEMRSRLNLDLTSRRRSGHAAWGAAVNAARCR
ncbi:hypothetical protein HBI56_216210 [Parastagonospora nodorum]|uniref:Uncharacterized protein n=1 Tax=Phaeosphaeria nodorum (strain SN15 / ATCC MYA-4574 / FGSC 10173) TaxID=321614 RepID=A0A7U2EZX4_PHANO|nr:hypothetical protein HBH56_176250 [Parastagonospora nodorum]QRC96204.1 hypothetical protein JI435_408430 [Parastagonospora nodorum SN15]KAH3926487.1 hypothetical protein HBH54_166910 [Parastagonospora nodorum]KAH3939151.1 hypothetical protein HBH53_240010 [Parastagonospora nodorum]KAH3965687.1 hypothetical protein HBH52_203550 [Parastagonospora nodorum]